MANDNSWETLPRAGFLGGGLGPRNLRIALVQIPAVGEDHPAPTNPRNLQDVVARHPAVSDWSLDVSLLDAVEESWDAVIAYIGPMALRRDEFFRSYRIPMLLAPGGPENIRGTPTVAWGNISDTEVDLFLDWLSRDMDGRESTDAVRRLEDRVEELSGVIDRLVVHNRDLESWADDLLAMYDRLHGDWQTYALNLKRRIRELEGIVIQLDAQLAAGDVKSHRTRNAVASASAIVTLIGAPMVYEWYDQHLIPDLHPSIGTIAHEVNWRCGELIVEIDRELPEGR